MLEQGKKRILSLILLIMIGSLGMKTQQAAAAGYGEAAYSYMDTLQKEYPQRVTGTQAAAKAREWLIDQCNSMGYGVRLEDAVWVDENGTQYSGTNLVMERPGESERMIVIGAHYDSVMTNGADDNASGVGLLLETAENCSGREDLPYTIRFILFDIEEPGCYGSQYYVSQLSGEERERIACMINLDTLCGGDNMYLYGGGYDGETISRTWLVEQALATARQMQLPMSYHPDVNESFPVPVKHTASDQMAFDQAGIPYLYFEASNWNGGKFNNFYQTDNPAASGGQMMHVPEYDNLEFYNAIFPNRALEHLKSYSMLLDTLISNLKEGSSEAVELSDKRSNAQETKAVAETIPEIESAEPETSGAADERQTLMFHGIDVNIIVGGVAACAVGLCLIVFLIQRKNR